MAVPRSITRAQRVITRTFSATAVIYRKAQVADDTGGYTDAYVATSTVQCSFTRSGITPVERENAVQVRSIAFFNVVFAFGTDVRPTDRVRVGTRTFEVVSSALGSMEIATRVVCQEIV